MRVFGWQTLMRNESDRWDLRTIFCEVHHRPTLIRWRMV
jgi:hypothetical protein